MTCSIETCGRPGVSEGLCAKHHRQPKTQDSPNDGYRSYLAWRS